MRERGVVRVGGAEFHVVGTVRGLASEAARVQAAFDEVVPLAVALGVGPEDLRGLEAFREGAEYEHEYSEADEYYAHFLGTFGKVELPPPDLVAAVREARARKLHIVPIDLPEVEYVDQFTRAVTGWQLLRYNRLVRRLAKRPPAAEDALEFHLAWDAAIRRLGGFDALEGAREQAMVRRLLDEKWPEGRVLVLVEAARVEGVLQGLDGSRAKLTAVPQGPEV